MRLRTRSREDEAFDGLTAEEIRRIRGAADACVTPGLEGLAKAMPARRTLPNGYAEPLCDQSPKPKNKRGRRA